MLNKKHHVRVCSVVLTLVVAVTATAKTGSKARKSDVEITEQATAVLWRNPDDIRTRNLFFGSGGQAHAPHTAYTFEKEDREGTSPKFVVHDENGVRWKVKMGYEARPEIVASRLVWAVGYATNEDYFLPELPVMGMPAHLHRGRQYIEPQGIARNVRLKRYLGDEKKVGIWKWRDNPFLDTRELNGLRVMMALLNNWDLKDDNNAIYREKQTEGLGAENIYMVSDLGASFGSTGLDWTQSLSKGNLRCYSHSKFISKVTPDYVDFNVPTRASLIHIFDPPEYVMRLKLRGIGKRVPRNDVRWVGLLLAHLSPEQIRDAFRAAGYPPEEVEGFSKVVEKRISDLTRL